MVEQLEVAVIDDSRKKEVMSETERCFCCCSRRDYDFSEMVGVWRDENKSINSFVARPRWVERGGKSNDKTRRGGRVKAAPSER